MKARAKFLLGMSILLMLIVFSGVALADVPEAPHDFVDDETGEWLVSYSTRINISDYPNRELPISWASCAGADYYYVSVKLLYGEPASGNDEPGDALMTREAVYQPKVSIPLDASMANSWLKVAMCAMNDDGQSAWLSLYLYLTDTPPAPPEINLDRPASKYEVGDTLSLDVWTSNAHHFFYEVRCNDTRVDSRTIYEDSYTISLQLTQAGFYEVYVVATNSDETVHDDPSRYQGNRTDKTVSFTVVEATTPEPEYEPDPEPDPVLPLIFLDQPASVYQVGDTLSLDVSTSNAHHFFYEVRCNDVRVDSRTIYEDFYTISLPLTQAGAYKVYVVATTSDETEHDDPSRYQGNRADKTVSFTVVEAVTPNPEFEPAPDSSAVPPEIYLDQPQTTYTVGDWLSLELKVYNFDHYFYEITCNGNRVAAETQSTSPYIISCTLSQPGNYTVHIEATTSPTVNTTDASHYDGLRAEKTVSFTVVDAVTPNPEFEPAPDSNAVPPEIYLDQPQTTYTVGDWLSLELKVYNFDHYFYEITCNGNRVAAETQSTSPYIISCTLSQPGNYTVHIEATTSPTVNTTDASHYDGLRAEKTVSFTVIDAVTPNPGLEPAPEHDPVLPLIFLDQPASVYQVGDTLSLDVSTSNAHHFFYEVRCNDVRVDSRTIYEDFYTISLPLTQAGAYKVYVVATTSDETEHDDPSRYQGNRADKTVSFTVVDAVTPNPGLEPAPEPDSAFGQDEVLPTIHLKPSQTEYKVGDQFSLEVSVDNFDHYFYDFTRNGIRIASETQYASPYTISYALTQPGEYEVYVVATTSSTVNTTDASHYDGLRAETTFIFTVSDANVFNPDVAPAPEPDPDVGQDEVLPTIHLKPSQAEYKVGDQFSLEVSVDNFDHYFYDFTRNGIRIASETQYASPYTISYALTQPGEYEVYVVATTSPTVNTTDASHYDGLRAETTFIFTVTGSAAETPVTDSPAMQPPANPQLRINIAAPTDGGEYTMVNGRADIPVSIQCEGCSSFDVSFVETATQMPSTSSFLTNSVNSTFYIYAPGSYQMTVTAHPADGTAALEQTVSFTVRAASEQVTPSVTLHYSTSSTNLTVGEEVIFQVDAVAVTNVRVSIVNPLGAVTDYDPATGDPYAITRVGQYYARPYGYDARGNMIFGETTVFTAVFHADEATDVPVQQEPVTPTPPVQGSEIGDYDDVYPQVPYTASFEEKLAYLRKIFPNGNYWNHMVGSSDHPASDYAQHPDKYNWSSTVYPCGHSHGTGKCDIENGSCGCNSFQQSIQCMGFAKLVATYLMESQETNIESWTKINYVTSQFKSNNIIDVEALKNFFQVGDLIRFGTDTNGHSAVIVETTDAGVQLAECNYVTLNNSQNCRIAWPSYSWQEFLTRRLEHKTTQGFIRRSPNASNVHYSVGSISFNGWTAQTVTPIAADTIREGLSISWSASNAASYTYKAILLDHPPTGAPDESQGALQVWEGQQTTNSFVLIPQQYIRPGLYIKIAVQAYGADGNTSPWAWMGIALTGSTGGQDNTGTTNDNFISDATANGTLSISKQGIKYIKAREGCRLTAYQYGTDVPTIGYGHTAGVSLGDTLASEAEAEALLREDLARTEAQLNAFINSEGIVLTQNEYDALVSFCFNAGCKYVTQQGYCAHDTLTKYHVGSAIPKDEVYRMFIAIHHGTGDSDAQGTKCMNGLFFRRIEEGNIFFAGLYTVGNWRTDYLWYKKDDGRGLGYCTNHIPEKWYPYEAENLNRP